MDEFNAKPAMSPVSNALLKIRRTTAPLTQTPAQHMKKIYQTQTTIPSHALQDLHIYRLIKPQHAVPLQYPIDSIRHPIVPVSSHRRGRILRTIHDQHQPRGFD